MDRICGIDPGLDGGLCLLERATNWQPLVCVMPTLGEGRRELDLACVLRWLRSCRPDTVVIEAQQRALPAAVGAGRWHESEDGVRAFDQWVAAEMLRAMEAAG